ncbi:unnamed protein product, partial [Ascophyllum nodosum]
MGTCPTSLRSSGRAKRVTGVPPSNKSGHDLGLDALLIALNDARNGQLQQRWYVSTEELQLVCVNVCVACRKLETSQIVVTNYTPPRLWRRRDVAKHAKKITHSRLPAIRVRAIIWERSIDELSIKRVLLDNKWRTTFPRQLICKQGPQQDCSDTILPDSLQQLSLVSDFSTGIDNIVWPALLQRLTLGPSFNHPVYGVQWPVSLQELEFGDAFDQSITAVVWPTSL